jgi:hypothetical protein
MNLSARIVLQLSFYMNNIFFSKTPLHVVFSKHLIWKKIVMQHEKAVRILPQVQKEFHNL